MSIENMPKEYNIFKMLVAECFVIKKKLRDFFSDQK